MSASLIGSFPTRGPWTALGLGRGWFLGILVVSIAAFVWIGGPIWNDPRGEHFTRITSSYAVIPAATGMALRRERPFPWGRLLAASAVLALMKLVATALLLGVVALAQG